MGMPDYYSEKCGECDTKVIPSLKDIGEVPFVIGKDLNYKCKNCGHEWEKKVWINY